MPAPPWWMPLRSKANAKKPKRTERKARNVQRGICNGSDWRESSQPSSLLFFLGRIWPPFYSIGTLWWRKCQSFSLFFKENDPGATPWFFEASWPGNIFIWFDLFICAQFFLFCFRFSRCSRFEFPFFLLFIIVETSRAWSTCIPKDLLTWTSSLKTSI